MTQQITVSLTEEQYQKLAKHLFPGDAKEAVALALCGRADSTNHKKLILHKLIPVPYEECSMRAADRVKWSTEFLRDLLIEGEKKNLSIVKIHSHPTGYDAFSAIDDFSDDQLFALKESWLSRNAECGSFVMLPDGFIFGRLIESKGKYAQVDSVQIIGDQIKHFDNRAMNKTKESDTRNIQTLGIGTVNILKNLKVAVVGCSGTGSPVIEQLARLGVGKLVLVDPDRLELKNLNRILNSVYADAENREFKVDIFRRFIYRLNSEIEVKAFNQNIFDSEIALNELSTSDVIFGCVDSIDGRHLLNLISTYYCIPYFDLGVKLIADGRGSIEKICGTVHYVKPGGSSLLSRGVYSQEDLRAASFYRANQQGYNQLLEEKYIKNINVESPAVISVNMQVASTAVNEFLCRIHKIRPEPMSDFAIARICISDGYLQYEPESEKDSFFEKYVGLGDRKPFVNLPELSFQQHDETVSIN